MNSTIPNNSYKINKANSHLHSHTHKTIYSHIPFLTLTILLLITPTSPTNTTNTIHKINSTPAYNFGKKQNFEIDLEYKHLIGTNLYFYSEDNSSIFIVSTIPQTTLEITMKLYTNNTDLISRINTNSNTISNGKGLFFGLDFNISNSDITLPYLRSDIILCCFNTANAKCFDYAYDLDRNTYINNTNSRLLMNNLIPVGFNKTIVNLLNENVMKYKVYYEISFSKHYPFGFDNNTMIAWLDGKKSDMNNTVTAFYGIHDKGMVGEFTLEEVYYYDNVVFRDGEGLDTGGGYISVWLGCFKGRLVMFVLNIVVVYLLV